ncbi:MAG TPA: YggS family pyridoxal phosphate-dependent enzyme [Candidatus Eisenbacteria bacterium]|nr:YggS family pyridoxal phosphate-dependent enzyme [Candidatus Eisenbacteria bacterium]
METLSERLKRIRERLAHAAERSGRTPGAVRLLAVTKGFPAAAVREAMALGLAEFGENRVQEADSKIPEVGPGPRWHLIGHLQRNKAKRAVALFDEIHSLDGEDLVAEVAKRAAADGKVVTAYVEVNTSGDPGKHGVAPEAALALVTRAAKEPSLRLAGLMTIGPLHGGAEGARASFRMLARLRDEAVRAGSLGPDAGLSMGMSDDFEIAVEEGATIVRVGSALFGDRVVNRAPAAG